MNSEVEKSCNLPKDKDFYLHRQSSRNFEASGARTHFFDSKKDKQNGHLPHKPLESLKKALRFFPACFSNLRLLLLYSNQFEPFFAKFLQKQITLRKNSKTCGGLRRIFS